MSEGFIIESFDMKLKQFDDKQAAILELSATAKKAEQELVAEFNGKVDALRELYEGRIKEAKFPLEDALAKYKAELKAFAGITDGEQSSVLDLVKTIRKISAR